MNHDLEFLLYLLSDDEDWMDFFYSVVEVEFPNVTIVRFTTLEALFDQLKRPPLPLIIATGRRVLQQSFPEEQIQEISRHISVIYHTPLNTKSFNELANAEQKVLAVRFVNQLGKSVSGDFIRIERVSLVPGEEIDFEVFNNDYEKVIEEGCLEAQALQNLSPRCFIKKTDEERYQKYLERVMDQLVEQKEESTTARGQLLVDYSTNNLRKIYGRPEQFCDLSRISLLLDRVIEEYMGQGRADLFFPEEHGDVFTHSVAVASLSVAVLNEIVSLRKNKKTREQVAVFGHSVDESKEMRNILIMAGLAHDIGKILLNMDCSRHFDELAVAEQEEFIKYVEHGASFLSKRPLIPPKVVELVWQHKEYADGSGRPNGLYKTQMSIPAQILSMANYFANLKSRGRSTDEALAEMESQKAKFNKHLLIILKHILTKPRK